MVPPLTSSLAAGTVELISAGVLLDLLNILAPWAEELNRDQVLVPVQVYVCFNHGCSAAVKSDCLLVLLVTVMLRSVICAQGVNLLPPESMFR